MPEQGEKKTDQFTTPKTEEQIREKLRAEYERIADKRVTDAIKKWEKRLEEQLNADKQVQEQENAVKQEEQAKEDEAREHDVITKSLKLAVVDALQELGLSPSLRNMIVVADLVKLPEGEREKKLTERVVKLYELFSSEVEKQVQAEKKAYLRGTTPLTSNSVSRSSYDTYKREGNVKGMISEKLREYHSEDE